MTGGTVTGRSPVGAAAVRPPADAGFAGRRASAAVCALVADWRLRAAQVRRYGAAESAAAIEACAADLEAALSAEGDELLTLAQAAAASGFSRDHIARLARQGALAKFGRRHAPRFRRADLPLKAGALLTAPAARNMVTARRQTVRASLAATGSD